MDVRFPVEFDDHGLLTGPAGDVAWPALCLAVEARVEEGGWDQPLRLFGLFNPVDTEAVLGPAENIFEELAIDDVDTESGAVQCMVTELGELGDYLELWGEVAPPWVSALVLAFEGWVVPPVFDGAGAVVPDPDADLPNSKHPRRVEMRSVLMVTRSGHRYGVTRARGEDPKPHDPDVQPGGLLPEVLMRMLGLATPESGFTVGDLLGRMALNIAATAMVSCATGDFHDMPAEVNEQVRAGAAQIAALPTDVRSEALGTIFATALYAALAHVTWVATNHGEGPGAEIVKPDRRLVRDAARKGALSTETLSATVTAARAAAGLSFNDLLVGRRGKELLPAAIAGTAPGWADEGLLSRRLCLREVPNQADIWEAVLAHIETPPDPVVQLLAHAGWGPSGTSGPGAGYLNGTG